MISTKCLYQEFPLTIVFTVLLGKYLLSARTIFFYVEISKPSEKQLCRKLEFAVIEISLPKVLGQ